MNTTGRSYDVITMGRSSIDLYSNDVGAPFVDITSFAAYVGGCPTNISVGTQRLGLHAALLTAVGDDQVGNFILHFLEQEGVETRFIPRKTGRRSSAVVLGIEPPDRFPLTYYRDNCADIELTIDDVLATPIARSRALLISGTGLSKEPSRSATLFAAEMAQQAGVPVVLDIDFRPDQWHDPRAFGVTLRSALGPHVLAQKRGADGSTVHLVSPEGQTTQIDAPGFPVEVSNILGAGDAFASGFLYGFVKGWDWYKTTRLANACGAILVTKHGCANFMPTHDEVMTFISDHGGF